MCDIGHFVLAYNHCCKWQDWNWLMGRGWERKTTHIHHKHTHKTYTHHRTQIQQAEVNTELVQVECVHKTPSLPLSCFLFPSLPHPLPLLLIHSSNRLNRYVTCQIKEMQLLFLRVSESTEGGRCTCYNTTVYSRELTNWYNKDIRLKMNKRWNHTKWVRFFF